MDFDVAGVFTRIAAAVPDRPCIVFRDRRLTYADVDERANRLANFLVDRGVAVRTPRSDLQPWESGQDHVAVYAQNGNEYLEVMIAAFKARAVPGNVNYRYVEGELRGLLGDMRPKAVVVQSQFAPRLAAVLPAIPSVEVVVQIPDESGNPLLPGAVSYEDALAAGVPTPPATTPSPDDLYMLYTGGTTGLPKGVLWRQCDFLVACLSLRDEKANADFESYDDVVARLNPDLTFLACAPFMHGAGHWTAFGAFLRGSKLVIPDTVDRFDPADVLRCVERERVNVLEIIGDAMGKPLVDELATGEYDVSSVEVVITSAVTMSVTVKERIVSLLPHAVIFDTAGSSETGGQMTNYSSKDRGVSTGRFVAATGTCVVDDDRTTVLPPGHDGVGWLARSGRLPLGYANDEQKTSATFVTVAGQRYCIPGDRARHLEDGAVELLGRESVAVNSGGEKIFVEEVEQAVTSHPDVTDVVVCGRPSERWGQEVVAVVELRPGASPTDEELLAHAARSIARFKLPKAIVRTDKVFRGPAGKADYAWAREQAAAALR